MLPEHQKEVLEITDKLLNLGKDIIEVHKESLNAFKNRDIEALDKIKILSESKNVDERANQIDNLVVKALALFEPEASELRTLVAILKITNEFIRVLNSAKKYSKNMKVNFENSDFEFNGLVNHIIHLHNSAINSFEFSVDLIDVNNSERFDELYRKIKIEESKTDDLLKLIEKELFSTENSEFLLEYINISTVAKKLERVADHSVCIANLIYFAKKGGKISSF